MSKIQLLQMPQFKRAYKKLHPSHRVKVNEAIEVILTDPKVGQAKNGDLFGAYVYQFKIQKQEMLLAYEWDPKTRLLLALGVHENFYSVTPRLDRGVQLTSN